MKLRTKFIILAILVALVTAMSLLVYIGYVSRTTIMNREENYIRVASNIAYNAILGQYDNAVTKQILDVYHIKSNLRESATIFTYFQGKYLHPGIPDRELSDFLRANQEAFKAEDIFLIAYYRGKFWGSREALELLDADTINKDFLRDLIMGDNPRFGTYDIAKLNGKTYLAYIFTPDNNREFNFAIIRNIDYLFSTHGNIENEILIFSRELFRHVSSGEVTPLYLVNENSEIMETNADPELVGTKMHPLVGDIRNRYFGNSSSDNDLRCFTENGAFSCYGYIKPLKMYLVSSRELSGILATGNRIMYGMTLITMSVLFIIILFSIGYIRRLTESLNSIAKTAYSIARADLSDPDILKNLNIIRYGSNDEVGNLSLAISNMSNSLITNINALVDSTARENRIKGELGVAYDIQMGMLPGKESIPRSPLYEISAFIHPAKEVGGDFYDVFRLGEDRLVITIGDVSDKGVPAAMFMSICVTLLRQLYKGADSIETVFRDVNSCLSERNPNMMFVTLFSMIVNTLTGDFCFCNAGHCPPLIVREKGLMVLEHLSGPALGVMEGADYLLGSGHLDPGDYLFIYTDGISEAQNEENKFFGEERIRNVLEQRHYNSAKSQVYSILDAIVEFRGQADQSDDMTMLSFRRAENGAAPEPPKTGDLS